MCSGPLFSKIVLFAFTINGVWVLQLLFNAADIIVVGRFAGSQSMAAVGSNGALINLMVNVFIGLSISANVLVARYYGARDEKSGGDGPYCDGDRCCGQPPFDRCWRTAD